jgi:hypothetical protein
MKAILLSFVFIYFSESGLFNGLRPIQIKFFLPSPKTRSGCRTRRGAPLGTRPGRPEFHSAQVSHHGMILAAASVLGKKMSHWRMEAPAP